MVRTTAIRQEGKQQEKVGVLVMRLTGTMDEYNDNDCWDNESENQNDTRRLLLKQEDGIVVDEGTKVVPGTTGQPQRRIQIYATFFVVLVIFGTLSTLFASHKPVRDSNNNNNNSNLIRHGDNDHISCVRYNVTNPIIQRNTSKKKFKTCKKFQPRSPEDELSMNQSITNADWSQLQTMLLFAGFARTGHTWIGSVLDAAPNAIIANEYAILSEIIVRHNHSSEPGKEETTAATDIEFDGMSSTQMYQVLAKNSYLCGLYGRHNEFDYTIPGLWQGRLDQNIQVIGDKKGENIPHIFLSSIQGRPWENAEAAQQSYQLFNKLKSSMTDHGKLQLRIIVVIRNPFDQISTNQFKLSHKNKQPLIVSEDLVDIAIEKFQFLFWAVNHLGEPTNWHVIATENFEQHTKQELQKLCDFTMIDCPDIMIEKAVNYTHHNPHSSRYEVQWNDALVQKVSDYISNSELAKFYSPCFYSN